MAYDEQLAQRVREALQALPNVTEKRMFSGIAFIVNDKMCINVSADRLMCRIGAVKQQEMVEKPYVEEMIMRGKVMKDYVYVNPAGFKHKKDFDNWVKLCLDFNDEAKSSKKGKS